MQFFEINCYVKCERRIEEDRIIIPFEERVKEIQIKNNESNMFFVTSVYQDKLNMCCISNNKGKSISKIINRYLDSLEVEQCDELDIREITIHNFIDIVKTVDRRGLLPEDISSFVSQNKIFNVLNDYDGYSVSEKLLPDIKKKDIFKEIEKLSTSVDLRNELNRIYQTKKNNTFLGHPAHYIIVTDDKSVRRESCKFLMNALYKQNRIVSKRYCYTNICPSSRYSRDFDDIGFENIYKVNIGGTVIVRIDKDYAEDIDPNKIEKVCNIMKKYRNDVLTIFCLPQDKHIKEEFSKDLCGRTFVTISDGKPLSLEESKQWLINRANDRKIKTDDSLFNKLEENKEYLIPNLYDIFNNWYDGLINKNFIEYNNIQCLSEDNTLNSCDEELPKEEQTAESVDSYAELMNMIGIKNAKDIATKAINFFKAQKLFKDKGINTDNVSMHMVFTGNPGTAKTTVARLLGQIMKENGILEKGHFVEVGRAGLVGKYVGHTAKLVQERFNEAKGGILFIDEAYSLVDDKRGLYGDEAINTIVQEMENNRDDVVVIFAGYPDRMEEFLKVNPGLRSRIAFHLHFDDYSEEELCDIAKYMADKQGLTLAEDALSKLRCNFEIARTIPDFGNGRYVRNLIENAKIEHATRLLNIGVDNVTEEDIVTITKEDIKECKLTIKQEKRRIGFGE